jgi:rhodanese-related sulfurtransferase
VDLGPGVARRAAQELVERPPLDVERLVVDRQEAAREVVVGRAGLVRERERPADLVDVRQCLEPVLQPELADEGHHARQERLADVEARVPPLLEGDRLHAELRRAQRRGRAGGARPDDQDVVVHRAGGYRQGRCRNKGCMVARSMLVSIGEQGIRKRR